MSKIRPHLWFDNQAPEAAEFYVSTFPDSRIAGSFTLHDTPSGDCDVVSFDLFGQAFQAISAGPLFKFTPAISFLVSCETEAEVDSLWNKLAPGGVALMPLDSYPFSTRFGWTQDRYGLSWQVMAAGSEPRQRITPSLLFVGDVCGKAEEAINHYTSIFRKSEIGDVTRYGADEAPEKEGTLKHGTFTLDGQQFAAMDSAREHSFTFNEAVSLMVDCLTQDEIDYYWDALSAVPESEQCGWLKDKYGVAWQIVPADMDDLIQKGTQEQVARVTKAFLEMKKFDIEELRKAYEGR